MKIKERFQGVLELLEKMFPDAQTELHYESPFGLLVAVVLSAQCTDKRVNLVTPALLRKYPDAFAMSVADPEEIFPFIRSVSYPNAKAKHLSGLAKLLVEKHDGIVPSDRRELEKLPGVGRKTANVIVSVLYDQPAMAVDTHVFRVSERVGLTRAAKNPLQAEEQLMKYIPPDKVSRSHHWLILHGRYTCTARSPKCNECGIREFCKKADRDSKVIEGGRQKKLP